jgi:hypothetical protein
VTTIASLALVPFAIALGLDVVVTFGHLFGEVSGMVAGITAGAVAIGFWYGYPLAKRRYNCEQESVMTTNPTEEPAATPLDIKIEQMLTEARVILPGAQALFGFQLAIVFTRSFADLPVVPMIMQRPVFCWSPSPWCCWWRQPHTIGSFTVEKCRQTCTGLAVPW